MRVLHQGIAVWFLALVFGAVVMAARDSTVTALDVARVIATVSAKDAGFLEAARYTTGVVDTSLVAGVVDIGSRACASLLGAGVWVKTLA